MSGNLFKNCSIPVISIEQVDAIRVQQELIDKIQEVYPDKVCLKLGSTGHKLEPSGDIDIGVKCKDIEELKEVIKTVFKDEYETYFSETFYIVSIKYEFDENRFVSVDFILVIDEEYSKFRYYCPDYINGESKYKVGTKIMYMGTILNHCCVHEQDNLILKLKFEPIGLYVDFWDLETNEAWMELASLDPVEIAGFMFKDKNPKHCNSIETLWEQIHSDNFLYPEQVKSLELSLFVNSYRKGWEELVRPEDFDLQYWELDEIKEKLKVHSNLRKINNVLNELTKK